MSGSRSAVSVVIGSLLLVLTALVAVPKADAASGDLLWSVVWPDPLPVNFELRSEVRMARGPGGDIWASTTRLESDTRDRDYLVVRYAPTGLQRWSLQTGTADDGHDYAQDIAVYRDGSAVVTGQALQKGLWTVKVSRAGKRLWSRLVPGVKSDLSFGIGSGVALDSRGNAYVAGSLSRKGGRDMIVLKYSPRGKVLWKRFLSAAGGGDDAGVDVVVGSRDRVFVTGTLQTAKRGKNVVVARYTPSGALVWKRVWDGGGGADDAATALAVSRAGVAVAAVSDPVAGDQSGVVLTARLTMARTAKLKQRVSGVAGLDLSWNAVAIDGAGDVAVCGGTTEATSLYLRDLVYARWLKDGGQSFTKDRPPAGWASGAAVALSGAGDLTVAGSAYTGLNYGIHLRRVDRAGAMWARNTADTGRAQDVLVSADGICVGGVVGPGLDQFGLWMYAP